VLNDLPDITKKILDYYACDPRQAVWVNVDDPLWCPEFTVVYAYLKCVRMLGEGL
jgi:hypothetical protein